MHMVCICFLARTTARYGCGTWTIRRACRRSRHTVRSSTKAYSMWLFMPLSRTSLVPGPTASPRCLSKKDHTLPGHVGSNEFRIRYPECRSRCHSQQLTAKRLRVRVKYLYIHYKYTIHLNLIILQPRRTTNYAYNNKREKKPQTKTNIKNKCYKVTKINSKCETAFREEQQSQVTDESRVI